MQKESQTYQLIKWGVIVIDFLVLNVVTGLFFAFTGLTEGLVEQHLLTYFILNITYLYSVSIKGPILQMRKVRPEQIVQRIIATMCWFVPLSYALLEILLKVRLNLKTALLYYIGVCVTILVCRFITRSFLQHARRMGRNKRSVVLVGSNLNIIELYGEMMDDPTTGYNILGYFDDEDRKNLPVPIPYLGTVDQVEEFIQHHLPPMSRLYCCLPSARAEEIKRIVKFCENHLIRFYSVPNVRNYLRRSMTMEMVGDVPVMSIREEPLMKPLNRLKKRVFDILFSGLFLCTLFPFVYIIVGLITKLTSPGPIFFKQKRNGIKGKEFYCYKFRSMKVNAQSDTLQATEHDPRKTKFGNFLRKSSIDELPQFINVFLGDMSVVGPRPHMLKHTEEYSQLIDKYMVRHYIKPGITGWAQVTGCRGETKELSQMEERIKKDIWYTENWSFWLDLRIIYLTVYNALHGEENAY